MSDLAAAVLVVVLILAGTAKAADVLAMPPEEKRRFTGRAGTMLLAWAAFVAIIGVTGVLAEIPLAVAPTTLISALLFARSPVGRLLETLPYHLLVGFGCIRAPLDPVAAALMLGFALFLAKKPWRPLIWTLNTVGLAALMAKTSFALRAEPVALVRFPGVLLPGVLVWAAVVSHVVVFQKLVAKD